MSTPIFNLSIEAYHASDYVSSSKLTDLEPCPLYFKRAHLDKIIPKPDAAHFAIGNAAHWLILEGGEVFLSRTIVHPKFYDAPESARKDAPMIKKTWNWNANACTDWRDQDARGKVVLSQEDFEEIVKLRDEVFANLTARALLTGGHAEVTFRRKFPLFGVQCRTDYWHADGVTLPDVGRIAGPVVVDLKTCDSIERFKRDFFDLRYHFRAEFYRLVICEVLAEMGALPVDEITPPRFFFVVVEKSQPYRVEVFEPDAESLAIGKREVAAALMTLGKCYLRNEWPGSKPGVQTIGLKSWQVRASDEATGAVLNSREAA